MKWWQPSTPGTISPHPWLSDEATEYLESILRPNMRVLEFGAGGSTLWLSERVAHVDSVENNPLWADAISKSMPSNVTLFAKIPAKNYDLIFIDGEPVEQRAEWLNEAPNMIAPGGFIVLDNANRPEYKAERLVLQMQCVEYQAIDGNEPGTKYLVTDFYRMAG